LDRIWIHCKNAERLLDWVITNRIEELKAIDVYPRYMINRGLQVKAVGHTIKFEAIKTGEFTLQIDSLALPITIFEQRKSIKKYVTQVIGSQWEGNVTSSGLPYDYTREEKRAILRIGDKIDFTFMNYKQERENPLKLNLKLKVIKQE